MNRITSFVFVCGILSIAASDLSADSISTDKGNDPNILTEISFDASYSVFSDDAFFLYWLEPAEIPPRPGRRSTRHMGRIILDTTAIGFTVRRNFKPRYYHPKQPFLFIPENHNNQYIEGFLGYKEDQLRAEVDDPDSLDQTLLESKVVVGRIKAMYERTGYFAGGDLSVVWDTDASRNRKWSVSLTGGKILSLWKVGLRVGLEAYGSRPDLSNFGDMPGLDAYRPHRELTILSDQKYAEGTVFWEYRPGPFFSVEFGATHRYGIDISYTKWELPVATTLVLEEHWWEFSAGITGYSRGPDLGQSWSNKLSTLSGFVSARKYIGNGAVFARAGMSGHEDIDYRLVESTSANYLLTGDYLFGGSVLVSLSYGLSKRRIAEEVRHVPYYHTVALKVTLFD